MPARLDSDLLRVFVAVADVGSVSGATASLGRAQSSVSVQIGKLEALTGQALFLRHARGVRLTPAGETLLVHARRVLSALAETEVALAVEPLAGTVRIGVPEEYGATVLPEVLARFEEEGYSELPGSAVVLRRAETARSGAAEGMATAIRGAFRQRVA